MFRLLCVACTVVVASSCAFAESPSIVLSVKESGSNLPIPARVYLASADGKPYFFESQAPEGTAFRYEKQNWINKSSVEYHTTVSAHPCVVQVPPGEYLLTVERGKTYRPHTETVTVSGDTLNIDVSLQRWIDMSELGWYSGDMHVHRELAELPNVVMAENLNVVFPLTNWVTLSDTPPSSGDKNLSTALPRDLIRVDDQHVIWPRSTEYEIFSVGKSRHTLGALFVLGHADALQQTVPPWKPVIDAARAADPSVLFDMDKLSWPFAMTLPVLAPDATYELANNHMWRTEFAFREWYTPAPSFLSPPFGAVEGGESDWIDFTLGMYYTLLNSGFHLPGSAGTANGVHPVPAGFGRVYVHQPDGFDFEDWKRGLQQGRSFVTTGPMLMATANGRQAGETFVRRADNSDPIAVHAEVVSEQPISFGEVVINGVPEHLLRGRSERTETGAYRTVVDLSINPERSGWFAVRFFEDRADGRVRFAHTSPWYVSVDDQPTKPTWRDRDYLVTRMEVEIQRSRGVVSEAALEEYATVLEHYRGLEVVDDSDLVSRQSRPLDQQNREAWLENMIGAHRFSPDEIRLATGMSIDRASRVRSQMSGSESESEPALLRVLPYPGGRHPRRGFLDGALDPQRETKVSIFPPWKDAGYVVVDVPEAIFSNLGLTYLAHRHIPTIWSEQSVELDPLEWVETEQGLMMERTLPNKIAFGSRVAVNLGAADQGAVEMEMWLTNGTDQLLTGLRSQVCVMLKGLVGFNSQRTRPSVVDGAFVAIRGDRSNRWLITAWQPLQRAWTNPPVPCIHSDPIFPDCPPGETVRVSGGMWFYEGDDITAEIKRLSANFKP